MDRQAKIISVDVAVWRADGGGGRNGRGRIVSSAAIFEGKYSSEYVMPYLQKGEQPLSI